MPEAVENRARVSMFTIEVDGQEHQVQAVTAPRRFVEVMEYTNSARVDYISLAGHLDVDTITIREAPVAGCLLEPAGSFLFDLEIGGKPIGHVRRISGLGVRWETINNRESTRLSTQKLWDKRRYNEVTTEIVVEWSEKWQLYEYVKKLGEFSGPGEAFSTVDGFTCDHVEDVVITLRANDGAEVAKWKLIRAWPVSYRPISDLDAATSEVGLVTVTWQVAPLRGTEGVIETILRPLSKEQLVSQAFYKWVAAAYSVPQRKNIILNLYNPGLVPGKDDPVGRLILYNAWVSRIEYADFDASRSEVLTREIEVTFDGFRPL